MNRRHTLVSVLLMLLLGCSESASQPEQAASVKSAAPDDVYHNPVDQKDYVAPGGWKVYPPESPRPEEPGSKVKMGSIRLLTSEADMAARIDVAQLAEYLQEAEKLADATFEKSGKSFQVIVQFKCTPQGHEIKLAHQGDSPKELLQAYYDALMAAKKLPVRSDDVSFQMELSVTP